MSLEDDNKKTIFEDLFESLDAILEEIISANKVEYEPFKTCSSLGPDVAPTFKHEFEILDYAPLDLDDIESSIDKIMSYEVYDNHRFDSSSTYNLLFDLPSHFLIWLHQNSDDFSTSDFRTSVANTLTRQLAESLHPILDSSLERLSDLITELQTLIGQIEEEIETLPNGPTNKFSDLMKRYDPTSQNFSLHDLKLDLEDKSTASAYVRAKQELSILAMERSTNTSGSSDNPISL